MMFNHTFLLAFSLVTLFLMVFTCLFLLFSQYFLDQSCFRETGLLVFPHFLSETIWERLVQCLLFQLSYYRKFKMFQKNFVHANYLPNFLEAGLYLRQKAKIDTKIMIKSCHTQYSMLSSTHFMDSLKFSARISPTAVLNFGTSKLASRSKNEAPCNVNTKT